MKGKGRIKRWWRNRSHEEAMGSVADDRMLNEAEERLIK